MKLSRRHSLGSPKSNRDPIEVDMEIALRPGRYISYGDAFDFVCRFEVVEDGVDKLIASEPERAATLYETFLAGCLEKAEEIDDSDDSLGMFISKLLAGWAAARRAAAADPDETARRLVAWMADDPYGYFSRLPEDVAPELDEAGLLALESHVRERLDAPVSSASGGTLSDYRRAIWTAALRVLLVARKDLDAYVRLCEESTLTDEDCLAVAKMLASTEDLAGALAWVERGLDLGREAEFPSCSTGSLDKMKRELLQGLGRSEESLESAWSAFQKDPSGYTYDELVQYVPVAEQDTWREKAVQAAGEARLDTLIDFWVHVGEFPRLAVRLRDASDGELEAISHFTTEKAADGLAADYPDVAARVYRALGMRVLHSKKSAYYPAALDNFRNAMECYQRTGRSAAWDALVELIFAEHSRKTSFMPGFKRLLSGQRPAVSQTFLERARGRWL